MWEMDLKKGIGVIIVVLSAVASAVVLFSIYREHQTTKKFTQRNGALNVVFVTMGALATMTASNLGVPLALTAGSESINLVATCILGWCYEGKKFSWPAIVVVLFAYVMMLSVSPDMPPVDPHDPRLEPVMALGCLFVIGVHLYLWRNPRFEKMANIMAVCCGMTAGWTNIFLKSFGETLVQLPFDHVPIALIVSCIIFALLLLIAVTFALAFPNRPIHFAFLGIILISGIVAVVDFAVVFWDVMDRVPNYLLAVVVFGGNQGALFNAMLKFGEPISVMSILTATGIVCVSFGGILTYEMFRLMPVADIVIFFATLTLLVIGSIVLSRSAHSPPPTVVVVSVVAEEEEEENLTSSV